LPASTLTLARCCDKLVRTDKTGKNQSGAGRKSRKETRALLSNRHKIEISYSLKNTFGRMINNKFIEHLLWANISELSWSSQRGSC
jgi:hypothetical protein